jgi:putative nucleotidyltransferase with HDIG domain
MMQQAQNHFIEVNQLRVGLYVHLDLGWMDHPFPLNNFKLKDETEITKIKQIGLRKLRYDPLRSDCKPLDNRPPKNEVKDSADLVTEAAALAAAEKQKLQKQRLHELHRALDIGEYKFIDTSQTVKAITKNICAQPQQSLAQADVVIDELINSVLNQSEIAIHAINGNHCDDSMYQHSLNVTVLSLLLAKSINITESDAHLLGITALLHDIGELDIPSSILLKKEVLSKSEQSFYEQHVELGAKIGSQIGLSERAINIIMQHHECADGSGYPNRIKLEQIDPLARIIALVSAYDKLCNPINVATAKTPYEALAFLFAQQRNKFEEALLKRMIKSLGIYPPGSIVQLSTGLHAIVLSVNPNQPLRPFVMLHDVLSDRDTPAVMDLRQHPSINIALCLRPNQLPEDALEYLNPRKRISYFVDQDMTLPA